MVCLSSSIFCIILILTFKNHLATDEKKTVNFFKCIFTIFSELKCFGEDLMCSVLAVHKRTSNSNLQACDALNAKKENMNKG